MRRFITLNSIYEVSGPCLRRVEGSGPSVLPVPDGEWLEAERVIVPVDPEGDVIVAVLADGSVFRSSLIVVAEDVTE